MENFLEMLEQILALSDEQLAELSEAYDKVLDSMLSNQTLINEIKNKFKIEGCGLNDLYEHKENLLAEMRALVNNMPHASQKQKDLSNKLLDIVARLYDEVATDYDFETITIPVEQCHPNAKIPTYAHQNDAGFDFYLPEDLEIEPHQTVIAKMGLKVAVPAGYELQLRPRSGLSAKTGLRIANSPGTLDSGYRDEIGIICWNTSDEKMIFHAGERIAQGVLNKVPKGIFNPVPDITKIIGYDRHGGFGSSGK